MMFINKSMLFAGVLTTASSAQTSKMTDYIYSFFNTEITCIPSVLKSIFGEYYNNGLCNMSTWAVAVWCIIHYVFDRCLQGLFKIQKYKEYIRTRLVSGLWYLGFYSLALIYCGATLVFSQVELFNFKKMRVPSSTESPLQVIMGYTLISTFYQHTFLWESISTSTNSFVNMWKYFCLAAFCGLSYTLRVPEICFTLTALSALSQVLIESTRLLYVVVDKDSLMAEMVLWLSFVVAFGVFLAVHIVVIPLTFILPLGVKVLSDYPYILLIFMLLVLIVWLILEIYNSILFQFFDHCFYHNNQSVQLYRCMGSALECALFPPRNDDLYNITIIRKEIEEREKERLSLRRPKNRSVLIQTLKCMVAIKKKLTHRKLGDASDSEESEKSESDPTQNNKNEEESSESEDDDRDTGSEDDDDDFDDEIINSILPDAFESELEETPVEKKTQTKPHCHAFTETTPEEVKPKDESPEEDGAMRATPPRTTTPVVLLKCTPKSSPFMKKKTTIYKRSSPTPSTSSDDSSSSRSANASPSPSENSNKNLKQSSGNASPTELIDAKRISECSRGRTSATPTPPNSRNASATRLLDDNQNNESSNRIITNSAQFISINENSSRNASPAKVTDANENIGSPAKVTDANENIGSSSSPTGCAGNSDLSTNSRIASPSSSQSVGAENKETDGTTSK